MDDQNSHSHRELQLIDVLRKLGGNARNTEIASAMQVSEETVRRLLKSLAHSGNVERVHGGAHIVSMQYDSSFFRRIAEHAAEKRRIADRVVREVKDGMALFLDVGSTTAFITEALRAHKNLQIVTNSIGVAQTLVNHNDNKVCLLGGEMQSDERGVFGTMTERQVRCFVFDLAILSADALNSKHGFLHLSSSEADLAAVVLECSEHNLMAVDHSKFGLSAPYRGLNPEKVDMLVTDQMPEAPLADVLKGWGVEMCLAQIDGPKNIKGAENHAINS